jgi:hypothetical protein
MESPFAEDVNYWKTSKSSPDIWIGKARRQIEKLGGRVLAEAYGSDSTTGRAAFMLAFEIADDRFKVTWPILISKSGNDRAARVQAATMLYHDVKARCISSAVLGPRTAFFSFLLLPDGRAAMEVSTPELTDAIPAWFDSAPQLPNGVRR